MSGLGLLMQLWTFLFDVVIAVAVILALSLAERRWPARAGETPSRRFNLAYLFPATALQVLLTPIAAVAAAWAVGALGGGLIRLPARGWGLVAGAVGYLIAMDLGEYLFHRAQHRFAFLWRMHSLHHSDESFNAATTVRHFWGDLILKSLTIYALVALLFRPSAPILEIYVVASFYNYLAHANLRLGFGRWSFALNSPQYHRLHHSSLPQDEGCNFAGLLPIFDLLSGAYRRPAPGEFPPTGLAYGERPLNVASALAWPLRNLGGRPESSVEARLGIE